MQCCTCSASCTLLHLHTLLVELQASYCLHLLTAGSFDLFKRYDISVRVNAMLRKQRFMYLLHWHTLLVKLQASCWLHLITAGSFDWCKWYEIPVRVNAMLHMQHFMHPAALTYLAGWTTSQLLTSPDNSWILWLKSAVWYIDKCECNAGHATLHAPCCIKITTSLVEL